MALTEIMGSPDPSMRLGALVRDSGPRALRIATRLVGAADAEDAVQEALLRTHLAGELREPEGFLIRTLVNHCLSVQRRKHVFRLLTGRASSLERERRAIASAEDVLSQGAVQAQAKLAVEGLPPMQRTVVQLRYGEELGVAEIAALLRIGEETVKTHLQRAMRSLREHVKEIP
jgi:RNA polymerase sigma-70 factor, ECF subfamily